MLRHRNCAFGLVFACFLGVHASLNGTGEQYRSLHVSVCERDCCVPLANAGHEHLPIPSSKSHLEVNCSHMVTKGAHPWRSPLPLSPPRRRAHFALCFRDGRVSVVVCDIRAVGDLKKYNHLLFGVVLPQPALAISVQDAAAVSSESADHKPLSPKRTQSRLDVWVARVFPCVPPQRHRKREGRL